MECKHASNLISRLIDGEIDETSARDVRVHIESCSGCAREYRSLMGLHEYLSVLPHVEPHPSLALRVKEALAGRGRADAPPASSALWWRVPVWAFLVLLAVGIGNQAGRNLTSAVFPQLAHEPLMEQVLLENTPAFSDVMMELGTEGHGQ
jgi:anti-sigma factor RsiW